jgi:hypothetical protein
MIFIFKGKLKKWINALKKRGVQAELLSVLEIGFEILEKLHICNAKTLFNLLKIYQDVYFLSLPIIQNPLIKPSFAMYMDKEGIILYSNKDFSTDLGKSAIYRHIIGNLKEICLKGSVPQTLLCPISYIKGSETLCKEGITKCWLHKLLRMSAKPGNSLICCKDGKANFVMTYEKANDFSSCTIKIDDRAAERRRKEIKPKTDIIQKIFEVQGKKLKKEPIQDDKYDGEIKDLYIYRNRNRQRKIREIISFLSKFFSIFLIPYKLGLKIYRTILGYKLKRSWESVKKAVKNTEKDIADIMRLVQNM